MTKRKRKYGPSVAARCRVSKTGKLVKSSCRKYQRHMHGPRRSAYRKMRGGGRVLRS